MLGLYKIVRALPVQICEDRRVCVIGVVVCRVTGWCRETFFWHNTVDALRKRRLAVYADPRVVLCQPAMCKVSNTQT